MKTNVPKDPLESRLGKRVNPRAQPMPQRKPNKSMGAEEMLAKGMSQIAASFKRG